MAGFFSQRIGSVGEFLETVGRDTGHWGREGNVRPWFRGQADAADPPLPSVLRHEYDQVQMTLTFRNRASAYHDCPAQDQIAEWLFLMQHYGLPTRLLDWTESPLIACLFAVEEVLRHQKAGPRSATGGLPEEPGDMGVWVLHPIKLNDLSGIPGFELVTRAECRTLENFKFAFGTAGELAGRVKGLEPTRLPLAVQARHLDMRMAGQQSCFTVHGSERTDFEVLLGDTPLVHDGFFRKYLLARRLAPQLLLELDELGISYATMYPDLHGLSTQLKLRFKGRPHQPMISPFNRMRDGQPRS